MLPICEKIFERIIFNSLYKYLDENKLLSVHQSGFRSKDSCVNQLLSIFHNLYKAFDVYPILETCGVFLDISKAFDKACEICEKFVKNFLEDVTTFYSRTDDFKYCFLHLQY